MEQIEVTFPGSIHPEYVKKVIEGNLKLNSAYTCTVTLHEDSEGYGENSFLIETDRAEAFYLIGMTASELIRATDTIV